MKVGRRDSKSASLIAANSGALPSPTSSLSNLIDRFGDVGLSAKDMVVLSGTLRAILFELKSNHINRKGSFKNTKDYDFDSITNFDFDRFDQKSINVHILIRSNSKSS